MREYRALRALRAGDVLVIDGLRLRMDVDAQGHEAEISAGDLYVAERNTGPQLLTALKVDIENRWIRPTTSDYSYDIHECVKVVEAT